MRDPPLNASLSLSETRSLRGTRGIETQLVLVVLALFRPSLYLRISRRKTEAAKLTEIRCCCSLAGKFASIAFTMFWNKTEACCRRPEPASNVPSPPRVRFIRRVLHHPSCQCTPRPLGASPRPPFHGEIESHKLVGSAPSCGPQRAGHRIESGVCTKPIPRLISRTAEAINNGSLSAPPPRAL